MNQSSQPMQKMKQRNREKSNIAITIFENLTF